MSDEPIQVRQPQPLSPEMAAFFTPEHLERRRQAMARYSGWAGHDALEPTAPSGYAEGIRTSTRLTHHFAGWPMRSGKGAGRKSSSSWKSPSAIDRFPSEQHLWPFFAKPPAATSIR